MEYSHSIPQPQQQYQLASQSRNLEVNFSWRQWKILITEPSQDEPVYVVKCHPLSLNLTFKSGPRAAKAAAVPDSDDDDNDTTTDAGVIGDGHVHAFKIDYNTHVHGRPIRVSAAKRLLTRYTYQSLAFSSDSTGNKPATMTWKSNSWFRCFDFILLDESQQLVAKFTPKYLGMRNIATIEFLGPKADNPLARDEVVVTGLTLYMCMFYRTSNIVPLVGALTARPGKDYKITAAPGGEDLKADEYHYSDKRLEDGQKMEDEVKGR
jgi:hypothetical protein